MTEEIEPNENHDIEPDEAVDGDEGEGELAEEVVCDDDKDKRFVVLFCFY